MPENAELEVTAKWTPHFSWKRVLILILTLLGMAHVGSSWFVSQDQSAQIKKLSAELEEVKKQDKECRELVNKLIQEHRIPKTVQ